VRDPLPVDLTVLFVPLSPEQRPAWVRAMRIIHKYEELAAVNELKLAQEQSSTQLQIVVDQTGTPMEGENAWNL